MSRKTTIGIGTLILVGGGLGVIYWLHGRAAKLPPEIASAESPEFHAAPSPGKPTIAEGAKSPSSPDAKKPVPPVDTALPLRLGELLEYTANVSNLNNVANLKLEVAGRGNFLGKSTWHLRAFAHTQNPLRMVFELDDQFDSYSDAGTLISLQYEMHLSERGQKVESVQRMTATGREPAAADATQARVLPGTRDPLGMMQYLRNTDWTKTPEVRCPVYDGHKLYDVRANLAGASETVTVPAGNFTASKLAIRVFDNGVEMKDASFTLFLAKNDARTPVLLEPSCPSPPPASNSGKPRKESFLECGGSARHLPGPSCRSRRFRFRSHVIPDTWTLRLEPGGPQSGRARAHLPWCSMNNLSTVCANRGNFFP
jgi:hypothetical protein